MTNNDLLRRLRYALNLGNAKMLDIFRQDGLELKGPQLIAMLKKEEEEGFLPCDDEVVAHFLDGLIAARRGKKEGAGEPGREVGPLDNNLILKKLRIALELKEEEMLGVFKSAGFPLSRSELSALFRAKGQSNYKACGDQLLRNFIKGLILRRSGTGTAADGDKASSD